VVQLDPQNADYWFNLAVSERRTKDYDAALKAVERSLALRPQDEEAQGLKANLMLLRNAPATPVAAAAVAVKDSAISPDTDVAAADNAGAGDSPASSPSGPAATAEPDADTGPDAGAVASQDYEPLERIARSYDESGFRQAAFEMEQMSAMKLHSMPAAARAKQLCQQGTEYVNDGLLLEAERQFQLAVEADPSSAAAYAGLAKVHEYAGSTKVAQREAGKSLAEEPNVAAYLVLARIALAQRAYPEAQKNVEGALKIDPNNSAAKGVLQALQAQQSRQ
jgi:tetratricopeptide (TPR) repeat protein